MKILLTIIRERRARPARPDGPWRQALALGAALLVWASAVEARPTIVFSCWVPPNVPLHQHLTKMYVDAFDALGYDFKMHYRPNQRALMEAKAGITDGDCARTDTYGAEGDTSPLVRVETQIASTSLEAWSRDPGMRVTGIDDLSGHQYRIGYVRGHVAVQALRERYPALPLTPVTSTEHGLRMLNAGRLDLYIGTSVSTRQEIAALQLPDAVYSAGHLMVLKGHPYLNAQHRSLAAPLAEALKKQLPDGGWHFE